MAGSGVEVIAGQARPGYRFDDLIIDVGTAQVHRGDQLLPLPRLSFDLLLALVQTAPNLVTVDDLMTTVWPGVVVNAETVSQRIKLLRVALEDDPRHPRYIAVSRGRGYRILAPVTAFEIPGATTNPPAPGNVPAPRSRWLVGAVAAAVLAGIAAVLFVTRNSPPAATAAISLP